MTEKESIMTDVMGERRHLSRRISLSFDGCRGSGFTGDRCSLLWFSLCIRLNCHAGSDVRCLDRGGDRCLWSRARCFDGRKFLAVCIGEHSTAGVSFLADSFVSICCTKSSVATDSLEASLSWRRILAASRTDVISRVG